MQVDAERTSFATPGEAETLELMSPLFVGGLDANIESLFLPPVLWSAGFRLGKITRYFQVLRFEAHRLGHLASNLKRTC